MLDFVPPFFLSFKATQRSCSNLLLLIYDASLMREMNVARSVTHLEGKLFRVDLVGPHSRVTPAVFVAACVAPMAFPICQGRPPSLEEQWKIHRPNKIKQQGYFQRILQVVDL